MQVSSHVLPVLLIINCTFDPQEFYGNPSTRLPATSTLCGVASRVADPTCSGDDRRDDTLRLCATAFRDLGFASEYYAKVRDVEVPLKSPRNAIAPTQHVRVPTFRVVINPPRPDDGILPRDREDDVLRVVCTSPYSVFLHVSVSLLHRR